MDSSGYNLLLRFIDSSHFTLFLCISYLARYADNVGVHFHLCQKLRSFSYLQIEFFLPQLCQIILTVPTESVALEDFLLDMCNRSTHSAVQTFWLLQAHLEDLSHDPEARSFQICRRVYNRVQYILFGVGDPPTQKIVGNPGAALVLASAVMGVTAAPCVTDFVGPITIAQARKPRLRVFHLANKKLLQRKSSSPRVSAAKSASSKDTSVARPELTRIETDNVRHNVESIDDETDNYVLDDDDIESRPSGPSEDREFYSMKQSGPSETSVSQIEEDAPLQSGSTLYGIDGAEISSLPDLRSQDSSKPAPHPSLSSTSVATEGAYPIKRSSKPNHKHPVAVSNLTMSAKIRLLKSNYFRYETAFTYALQAISTRLKLVPKPARLSALRAEIALLNNELPAEVDIPMILETDTYRANPRQHKIVRISPAEATVLSSAERVPFLLMIEVLMDDVTFDPDTERNQDILRNPADYRSLFDFAYSATNHGHLHLETHENGIPMSAKTLTDSEMGDISVSTIADVFNSNGADYALPNVPSTPIPSDNEQSNGNDTPQSVSPRSTELSFSSSYKHTRSDSIPMPRNADELNDMAVHMRAAATMLAQLDVAANSNTSTARLSKDEVQGIKSRIVHSMQMLEDQVSFNDIDIPATRLSSSSVRSIITAKGAPAVNREAGERRMENDFKTGVIKSDETEIGFGEEWEAKKRRIRESSPYGHLPNWDLVSVIAKTGSDLRQEAFACQIIQAIKRIWEEADVDVWVRRMAILVTGAGSGLVETITNGVSLHSLKKALATSMFGQSETAQKQGARVATLSEYFFRVFGVRGSETFVKAQTAFIKSLAAYSLICYLLQIKDRHNGNILLDTEGHIIHIDFGFLLSNSPGSVGFEAAPFKLTQEYVELMGGPSSEGFESFRALTKLAFKALRKKADDIVLLVEMMQKESPLPCFQSGEATAQQLRARFHLQLSEADVDAFVDYHLINKSMNSVYTRLYDHFQLVTQGIYS
ncbi:kinase-like domain-containing protein [Lipomyces oligophaga]|uniref:kinase-like domain-containing protein n=1 Tax=Lipomyces oligophaga TaxID=45792 RepID=UPI0034CF6728